MSKIQRFPPATWLIQNRHSLGWTQSELSSRSGVSQTMISDIERGLSVPTLVILQKLAKAFGKTTAELVEQIDQTDYLREGKSL